MISCSFFAGTRGSFSGFPVAILWFGVVFGDFSLRVSPHPVSGTAVPFDSAPAVFGGIGCDIGSKLFLFLLPSFRPMTIFYSSRSTHSNYLPNLVSSHFVPSIFGRSLAWLLHVGGYRTGSLSENWCISNLRWGLRYLISHHLARSRINYISGRINFEGYFDLRGAV